jgi:Na+/proline symporter
LPRGLIGLLLAVILSAAMSSTASELNALGSTTAIDLYRRNTPNQTERHYLRASKWFTLLWGIIAIMVASFANLFDNLIQLVNIIGSIFYGNILGVFLLGFFIRYVKGTQVFIAALINQVLVILLYVLDLYEIINLPYLWLNFVGCISVMVIAIVLQKMLSKPNSAVKA